MNNNRLSSESSPYLLQHADNPVDWFAWGEEAFLKAKEENKPVFLSIGYSTCHWCHVMAHESFENTEVAQLINDTFVPIKVDREERPDIDNVYMTVCQMMTGSGGWPLTIIMTPEKEPFFSATYIPRETRFGQIGLTDLIPRIQQLWSTRQSEVLISANQIKNTLKQVKTNNSGEELNEAVLDSAYQQLEQHFDNQNGGFGSAPKFPSPHNLLFLLRYWKRSDNQKALEMVEKTLQSMRNGGIYDHIGFGFHRYSTDSQWLVPHFEKMLYDQALLAIAYIETYQATGKEEYSRTTSEILDYVLRDMQSPEGGFYSAEDADSEGEEGKFYVWTLDEIKEVLSEDDTELAMKVFNLTEKGNFKSEISGVENGTNILHLNKQILGLAEGLDVPETELRNRLEDIRKKLFAHREKRVHPQKDDKILTDWNGLMIAALAKGGQVLGNPLYIEAACRATKLIVTNLRNPEGRLLHSYRNDQAAVPANLDDYAFMIYALLELYETTFEVDYLKLAIDFNSDLIKHFSDESSGGFFFTSDDAEELLVRPKEVYDGAIPSGNSIEMLNLLRLSRVTADPEFEQKAAGIGAAFSEIVRELPSAHTQLLVALDFAIGPSYEIVIAGNSTQKDTEKMITSVRQHFIPNKVVIQRQTEGNSPRIDEITSFTSNHVPIDDKATAYVCLNNVCKLPTTDIDTMLKLLNIS